MSGIDDDNPPESEDGGFEVDSSGVDGALAAVDFSQRKKRGRPAKKSAKTAQPAAEEQQPVAKQEQEASASAVKKGSMLRKIDDLRKKLKATGSGAHLTAASSEDELQAEIDLMNHQINTTRGEKAFAVFFKEVLVPIIQKVADYAVKDKTVLDLSSEVTLKTVVAENWDLFEDAVTQISITHADYFGVSPYSSIVKSTLICAQDANEKNQKIRTGKMQKVSSSTSSTSSAK